MKYATVCSGIEAPSCAWHDLGFQPVFFSEIEPFPSALLSHRFPDVPNLGDMTKIDGNEWSGKLDLLWGSTPCQSFSSAGKRAGLNDDRGKLMLKFCELADQIDPDYVCWENVKGALTADDGEAFGTLLGLLSGENEALIPPGGKWSHAGCVSGPKRNIAWRLLDAKYAGVAQRRERVFVVGCPRGGASPFKILFEEGSSEKTSKPNIQQTITESISERAYSLAFRGRENGESPEIGDEQSNCLRASKGGSDKAFVFIDGANPVARQLTPLECERLMGFPENWTDVLFNGKPASDSVRYKALGNSIAIPDVRWIGQKISQTFSTGT